MAISQVTPTTYFYEDDSVSWIEMYLYFYVYIYNLSIINNDKVNRRLRYDIPP